MKAKDMIPEPEQRTEELRDAERINALFDLTLSGNPVEGDWILIKIKTTMGIKGVFGKATWRKIDRV